MVNPVQSITEYNGDDFAEYLEVLQLIDIFEELIKQYANDKPLLKQITKYIVWTYSLNSEKVIIGMDWEENKKKIYEYVMLPPTLYSEIVDLQEEVIVRTIDKWLVHQDKETYTEFCKLRDLKLYMQKSYSDASVDANQRFKNAGYSKELTLMIKDLQNELIQSSQRLSKASAEIKNAKRKNTMGPEKFATVK